MTNLTTLLCAFLDHELTADERLTMMAHIQQYGRIWLPYIEAELPGADYVAAIVELAAFAEVPGFAAYAATMEVTA